jgi:hypothetical protein
VIVLKRDLLGSAIALTKEPVEWNRREVRADLTEEGMVGGKMALYRLSPYPSRPGMK